MFKFSAYRPDSWPVCPMHNAPPWCTMAPLFLRSSHWSSTRLSAAVHFSIAARRRDPCANYALSNAMRLPGRCASHTEQKTCSFPPFPHPCKSRQKMAGQSEASLWISFHPSLAEWKTSCSAPGLTQRSFGQASLIHSPFLLSPPKKLTGTSLSNMANTGSNYKATCPLRKYSESPLLG